MRFLPPSVDCLSGRTFITIHSGEFLEVLPGIFNVSDQIERTLRAAKSVCEFVSYGEQLNCECPAVSSSSADQAQGLGPRCFSAAIAASEGMSEPPCTPTPGLQTCMSCSGVSLLSTDSRCKRKLVSTRIERVALIPRFEAQQRPQSRSLKRGAPKQRRSESLSRRI